MEHKPLSTMCFDQHAEIVLFSPERRRQYILKKGRQQQQQQQQQQHYKQCIIHLSLCVLFHQRGLNSLNLIDSGKDF